jgi:cell division septum initiation protein DivIVA
MESGIGVLVSSGRGELAASAFSAVARGYDRHQVDEYFKQTDTEMRQHREQIHALQQELGQAHWQVAEQKCPAYAGPGSRIEQLVRLAGEQKAADQLVAQASGLT